MGNQYFRMSECVAFIIIIITFNNIFPDTHTKRTLEASYMPGA